MKNQSYILVCSCCLLFLLPFQASAQRIYFSDTTNEWRTARPGEMGPSGMSTYSYEHYYATDTLVERNGHYYTEIKLAGNGWNMYFEKTLVRDDTTAGLVYIKPETPSAIYKVTDSNEFVYLNYNLRLGDTLTMPLVFSSNNVDSISIHVVHKVDSFIVDGIWYKELEFYTYKGMGRYFNGIESPNRYTVYEGTGPESGPLLEPNSISEYGPPSLICFRNRGLIPSKFGLGCFDPVAIKEPEKEVKHFQFYPNPALDKLTVRGYGTSDKSRSVKVSDLQGKVLLETKFNLETVLDVEHFAAGIYILQFINNKVVVQSDKLIIRK